MIHSMTGFGRVEVERDGRTLVAEARSVNHRFLELSIRLPRGFQPLEGKLRSCIQERVARGKVNFTVSWKGSGENGGIALDMDMVQQDVEVLQEVRSRFDFREPVTLGQVLALPDCSKRSQKRPWMISWACVLWRGRAWPRISEPGSRPCEAMWPRWRAGLRSGSPNRRSASGHASPNC